MSQPSAIAIDGPAASGKTTLARHLAKHLGYLYFDTGVMYRAVTLAALERGIDLSDELAVVRLSQQITIDVQPAKIDEDSPTLVYLDGHDVTHALRATVVDANVSVVSAYPGVRKAMTSRQREIARRGRVVMVGRDIGTVVLPEADLKLYLDASVEERARRRWQEYQMHGRPDSYAEILAAMRKRDEIDSQRAVAPLRPAHDAIMLNTTDMEPDEVLAYVLALIKARDGQSKQDRKQIGRDRYGRK